MIFFKSSGKMMENPFGGRAGMVPPLEESEDGNRASFPRRGKRSVIYNHFTGLDLEIMEMSMIPVEINATKNDIIRQRTTFRGKRLTTYRHWRKFFMTDCIRGH